MMLSIQGLVVELGGRPVLNGASLELERGSFGALLGPNGSGKTTLERSIYRAVKPSAGRIAIDGRAVESIGTRELARTVAVLRQEVELEFDFSVLEIVRMGRSPYKGLLEPDRSEDHAIVERCLSLTDAAALKDRIFTTLSGGEKQRVLLARALAQEPKLLLLDEPTSHLDLRHQLELLGRVRKLGITVLAALHDLNLALEFADRAFLLERGRIAASGSVAEVLSPENIARVFEVNSRLCDASGRAHLAFEALR
jgi:iron complex transport system ATP-binding protein